MSGHPRLVCRHCGRFLAEWRAPEDAIWCDAPLTHTPPRPAWTFAQGWQLGKGGVVTRLRTRRPMGTAYSSYASPETMNRLRQGVPDLPPTGHWHAEVGEAAAPRQRRAWHAARVARCPCGEEAPLTPPPPRITLR
jgi:hypothetical protein